MNKNYKYSIIIKHLNRISSIILLILLTTFSSIAVSYSDPAHDNISVDVTFKVGQNKTFIEDLVFGTDPDYRPAGIKYDRAQLHIWTRDESVQLPGLQIYLNGQGIPPYKTRWTERYPQAQISGTPTKSGKYKLVYTGIKDDPHHVIVSTLTMTLNITIEGVEVLTPALANGKEKLPYAEQTLTASGGTAPYTYNVIGLPKGLTYNGDKISGIPTVSGKFNVEVTATDSKNFTGEKIYPLEIIAAPKIVITPDTLPAGKIDRIYQEALLSATGSAGAFNFTVTGLPEGLSFKDGKISGIPIKSGKFDITVVATDIDKYTETKHYPLEIIAAPKIIITPDTLPAGKIDRSYQETLLSATGSAGTFNFTVTGLPEGLSFKDGKISGTPEKSGKFDITVVATDIDKYTETKHYPLEITTAPKIIITPDTLPAGKIDRSYPETILSATGSAGAFNFTVTGLPEGLSFKDGKISGTPVKSGKFDITVVATDIDKYTETKHYPLEITAAPKIVITPDTLPSGKIDRSYQETILSATGSAGAFNFTVTGLPEGLSFKDGKISGTPVKSGKFDITVVATDIDKYAETKHYPLEITAEPKIVITPDTLPSGKNKLPYTDQSITASGGTAPYTYKLTELPKGLIFNGNTISGTPSEAGNFNLIVEATDAENYKITKNYTLSIINVMPQAQSLTLDVIAGASASVELTQGASGGPFIGAKINTAPKLEAGQAQILSQGDKHLLQFHASPAFSGATQLTYTLSNPSGASAPALVTINVIARPDPSKDEEVIGLVRAQIDAANQLATTQISNYNQRLEQLHNEGECREISIGLGIEVQGQQLRPNLNMLNTTGAKLCSELRRKFSVWTNGEISFGKHNDRNDKNRDVIDQKHTSIGISSGVDYRFSSTFIGGIGVGYGHIVTDIGKRGTQNKGTMLSTGLYGSYRPGNNIFLDGVLGYGWLQFDSKRFVTSTGGSATGERRGNQIFGSLTLGYEHHNNNWLLSPYTRLDAAHTKLSGFSEKGAGNYNLTFGDQTIKYLSTTLGVRTEYTIPTEWALLKPHGRLEYTHNFSGSSHANVNYANIGGSLANRINISSSVRDSFKVEFGVDAQLKNGLSIGANYSTRIAANSSLQHNYRLKLSKTF